MNNPTSVEQLIGELKGRQQQLQAEIARIETTLNEIAGFVKTPTREEHANGRRKHEPLPLRATRLGAGITVAALAGRLKVSPAYLSQIEGGSRPVSQAQVQRFEEALQAMIAEQKKGEENQQ